MMNKIKQNILAFAFEERPAALNIVLIVAGFALGIVHVPYISLFVNAFGSVLVAVGLISLLGKRK